MPDRFYAPNLARNEPIELDGPEAKHLLQVLRASPGDRVELFDGRGQAVTAEVVSAGKKSAGLRIVAWGEREIESERALTLATAIPKGDRFRWLVEKATELGVERLVPLRTERGVVHPRESKLDRLQQTVIAACKQSGRNRLMAIDMETSWGEFVSRERHDRPLLVAHPGGEPLERVLAALPANADIVAAIGPEGGFTDAELESARQAGARLVSLSPHILRIETAAIAMAAIITQRMMK